MKNTIFIVLTLALILFLSSCGQKQDYRIPDTIQEGSVTSQNSDTQYPDMILTKEQMLQDYDTMWDAMEENYPFFGVIDRRNGEIGSYKTIIMDYRKQIEDMELQSDEAMFEFMRIIAYSLYEVTDDPHVSIINPNKFRSDRAAYNAAVNEMPVVQPWLDVLENPQVISLYEYYDYLLNIELQKAHNEEQESVPTPEEAEAQWEEELNRLKEINLATKILEEGKIAYIKVASFGDVFIEGDIPKIHAFLQEIKDYEHLIIDISENGGGNSEYWEEAFVLPNISEPVITSKVRLMKNTELSQKFYGSDYKDSKLTVDAVKSNLHFTALPLKDLTDLTFARELPYVYQPTSGEKLFQGQVWVLTGPAVYSSAESFAVFCKSSDFATLVGKTTGGGDTGGPVYFELPISHILIQFDVEYCLNPDGSCSQEIGTIPDIDSEDALKTTLDMISG